MKNAMRCLSFAVLILLGVFGPGIFAEAAESDEGILVGRIAHIEGTLLRYIEEEKDWVATVNDAPFGLEDALYSEDDAKAEFIMPNGTWMRIDGNTQLQLIALNPDNTTVDVASGAARLYNKSRDTILKVTTPFGYVVAPGDTVFDLYVGDESLEVIAVRGDLDFVHDSTNAKYKVNEGLSSIIADKESVVKGNGTVDAAWDDWNAERDRLWAKRLEVRGDSVTYLPEPIREEAYTLEENGRWERVYYEGSYHEMWRPTRVEPGWRPFTAGRWTVYYGDNCWIPDEPFGYVTHHYGSWIYVDSFSAWFWAPPVYRTRVRVPVVSISFGWYPGRVGWIHSGVSVGWVPLGPREVYHGYRPWGHRSYRTVIVDRSTVINININQYRYLDRAVIINRDNLYSGRRYTPHIEHHIDRRTIINNYKSTTVINNTVINNFNTDKRRFTYNDKVVTRKPHSSVISRIDTNQKRSRDASFRNKRGIEQDLTRISTVAEPVQKTDVRPPRLRNKLVDADKVSKPVSEVSFTQKEIKPKERERQLTRENRAGSDRQRRGVRDQGPVDQAPDATGQEAPRRLRSPRDAVKEGVAPATEATPSRPDSRRRGVQDRDQADQTPDAAGQEAPRRLRSPRDAAKEGVAPATEETPSRPDSRRRGVQDRGQADQAPDAAGQEAPRRLRSPRDTVDRSAEQTDESQTQGKRRGASDPRLIEQPRSSQGLTPDTERQQDQSRRRQQEEAQRGQELQQQQQQETLKRQQLQQQKQEEEVQRRQGLQQQKQQEEAQRRQELQRQQQQEEAQRRQELQQQKQQQEAQRRQELQQQQQQQEAQRRQELQRQQEAQRRQEQQQQQQEAQRRQQLQQQQQQQQEAQRRQQLQQQELEKKKKKALQEQEEPVQNQ